MKIHSQQKHRHHGIFKCRDYFGELARTECISGGKYIYILYIYIYIINGMMNLNKIYDIINGIMILNKIYDIINGIMILNKIYDIIKWHNDF